MSIQPITNSPLSLIQADAVQKPVTYKGAATNEPVAASKSNSATDQTSLSAASTLLVRALRTPDVRTEKVATLQAALAAGTYNVSSADVADKLVETLLS
jgi:negative regulator of flagellin synthesis FlgM